MKEMDIVEVTVEKERYAKEGIHKGMQGWICHNECVYGCWLTGTFIDNDRMAPLCRPIIILNYFNRLKRRCQEET